MTNFLPYTTSIYPACSERYLRDKTTFPAYFIDWLIEQVMDMEFWLSALCTMMLSAKMLSKDNASWPSLEELEWSIDVKNLHSSGSGHHHPSQDNHLFVFHVYMYRSRFTYCYVSELNLTQTGGLHTLSFKLIKVRTQDLWTMKRTFQSFLMPKLI